MTVLPATVLRARPAPEVYDAARAAGILTLAGAVTGVSNLGFTVMIARIAGAQRFGAIGALLSLITAASFIAIGTQYAVARRAALHDVHPGHLLLGSARSLGPWFAVAVPFLVIAGPVSAFLHLTSAEPTVTAFVTVLVLVLTSLPLGVLLGRRRFRAVAVLNIGNAVARLLLGALLSAFVEPTASALWATLLPAACTCLAAGLLAARGTGAPPELGRLQRAADVVKGLPRDSVAGAIGSMAVWAVWAVPLVAAQHGMTGSSSGRFAAAQALAGAILFLVAPVTAAFFPTIARHRHTSALVIGMVLSSALALVATAALTAGGPPLIASVYGSAFRVDRMLLLELGLSATSVAVTAFVLWAARARHGRRSRVTMVAVAALILEVVASALLHPGPHLLAVTPLAVLAAASMISVVMPAPRGWLRAISNASMNDLARARAQ